MKLTKILSIAVLAILVTGCNKPAGELVGAGKSKNFKEANPYGMIFIKKGSFMMGANTQSAVFDQPDNIMMATVEAFWMDETEITNNEYRQFVNYVRDSMALAILANHEDFSSEFALEKKEDGTESEDEEEEEGARINWKKKNKLPWNNKGKFAEGMYQVLRDSLVYYSDKTLNNMRLYYRYGWVNYDEAVLQRNKFDVALGRYPEGASVRVDSFWVNEDGTIGDSTIRRPLREPKDLVTHKIICVYPDTLVWVRDFEYSYNDPMTKMYFSHPGYAEYPVVGVTWEQAHAFCNWRTEFFNGHSKEGANDYRLPTEAEWEYASRGGRKMSMYPWGGNYARDAKGCFFANFKPYRGSYGDDTGITPIKVAQYRPNDFGLFDMAGNVSEWTMSAYRSDANTNVHDLNPNFVYMARKDDPDILKKKVIRGGSWKDISFYLQCGVRTYEYQYESRPYIGFRCVRRYIGE
ncbi:MAG: SUMF1/EgtB/PvdO family nonheme iron enzyme [Paludibacteraceae bacterium]|nr:SUMF1/EgtB/PvdO family nonheme iron enzyme [Paludibacteraceae bacterium]